MVQTLSLALAGIGAVLLLTSRLRGAAPSHVRLLLVQVGLWNVLFLGNVENPSAQVILGQSLLACGVYGITVWGSGRSDLTRMSRIRA